MDFYKKINMDNFKPKLPSIKLQMPTLKSRKIFKTSKEDLSKNPNVYTINTTEHQELPRFPPATFIERTPRRISTVSSLQVQQEQSDIILEDSRVHGVYTNYENRDFEEKKSAEQNDEGLHQRFTRRYKEFQEFKFKNIFGKRTVVRKTEISMDMYADRYKEDLEVERQRRQQQDRQNSIEYNFQFKDSKQNSRDDVTSPTTSVKSNASTLPIKEDFRKRSRKSQQKECKFKSESLDSVEEKPQVEYSQSWRFGTLRGKSINRKDSVNKRPQSIRKKSIKEKVPSEEVGTKKKWTFKKPRPVEPPPLSDQEAIPEPKKNRWTLRNSKTSSNATTDIVPSVPKKKWTLRSRPSIDDEPEKVQTDVNKKKNKKHKTRPKSKDEGSPREEIADSSTKKKSWSMKKHMSSSVESYSSAKEEFQNSTWNFRKIKGSNLLSKWKSRTMQVLSQPNLSTVGLEGNTPERKQKITLRIWKRKKNVKKAASTDDITTGAEPKTSFFNFKYFNKKENEEQISVEEAIIDNRKLTHKERLENAKDRAKQAVNDQIQKLHFFRSQQTSKYSEDSEKGKKRKKGFDEDLDDEVAAANIEEIQNSPAAIWASEQEFNQSINTLETNDYNMNMPKVLIRQQSYENREPTLVITMTSSRLHPHISPLFRGRRLESLDSNDSDTWISNTYNNIIVEKEVIEKDSQEYERNNCKLHTLRRVESVDLRPLPRRTSVDVFHNEKPFENFDMELQDTPIISIESEIPPPPPSTSPPREESPERVVEQVSIETVVMEQHTHIVIKKKEESIEEIEEPVLEVADTNENFIQEKDPIFEGEKNEPTIKHTLEKQDVKSQNLVKPRSSFKRPSVQPPNVPERTASMVNLPRPIIKQGSLRRKLSADLESKIGKVNSLINKFENSHEDLTDSTKSSTNEMENTERPVSDLENNNTSINNESKPTKLKTIEVKTRAIAPAVPIPSPRITSEKCSVPKQSDPVANIPVIPSGNSANVKPVQAKDDENYFSLSDEENSNFYSMGNDVPVFTKQTYIFEF